MTNFIRIEMSKIKHSLKIELAIDAAIYKLRSKLLGESPQLPSEVPYCFGSPTSSIESASELTDDDEKMPCTPLWQMEDYENQLPILIEKKTNLRRPSLLPHDISRRGSNLSIRDVSPSVSTKFERRKQITSTQFFISPDFEWHPTTTDQEFKNSFVRPNKNRLSIVIPK